MEKLKKLVEACKFGLDICAKNHNPLFMNMWDYLYKYSNEPNEISDKIGNNENLIEITCYPDSAVGYFTVYHYDIELAIDEALTIIENG